MMNNNNNLPYPFEGMDVDAMAEEIHKESEETLSGIKNVIDNMPDKKRKEISKMLLDIL